MKGFFFTKSPDPEPQPENEGPERYAFIDVPNSMRTALDILGFQLDWTMMFEHLTGERWRCKEVYYYQGQRAGEKHERRFESLRTKGYIVRSKLTHIHPDKTREHSHACPECKKEIKVSITTPGNQKSNCDVDLTVDAMELASDGREFLIFTGDGDFAPLIDRVASKGVHVRIVSSTARDRRGQKVFSTRLADLLDREEKLEKTVLGYKKRISFIDLNDWKMRVSRSKPQKERGRPQA